MAKRNLRSWEAAKDREYISKKLPKDGKRPGYQRSTTTGTKRSVVSKVG